MYHHHADRDVGAGQGIRDRISAHDLDRSRVLRWKQVNADDIHTELPAYLLEQGAVGAADVEYPANRERVAADAFQNRGEIAEPAVRARQIAITSSANFV